jgi:hypothetical protein
LKQLFKSAEAWIVAGLQGGENFDLEVMSLPGGSVIAVLLWLCASALTTLKRGAPQYRAVDDAIDS